MDSQHLHDTLVALLWRPNIGHADYQLFLVDNYKPVDVLYPHTMPCQHSCPIRTLYDTLDSIDHKLRRHDNLRCIDRLQWHKKPTDCLVFQPDKYNLLYDSVPSIQHRDRIELIRVCKDSSISHCCMSYRTDSHNRFYIPACSIALEDHLPIRLGNSTMVDVVTLGIRHYVRMDFVRHMDLDIFHWCTLDSTSIPHLCDIPVMVWLVLWSNWRMDRRLGQLDICTRRDCYDWNIRLSAHMGSLRCMDLVPF